MTIANGTFNALRNTLTVSVNNAQPYTAQDINSMVTLNLEILITKCTKDVTLCVNDDTLSLNQQIKTIRRLSTAVRYRAEWLGRYNTFDFDSFITTLSMFMTEPLYYGLRTVSVEDAIQCFDCECEENYQFNS